MRTLTKITKPENCFYTVDDQTLRNLQDLLEYLMNCRLDQYSAHVNGAKNDFAEWVENVLLFPELARSLRSSKDIHEAENSITGFFQTFDYKSVNIPEKKYFFTTDNCTLKSLHELYYYLNNCSPENYSYHVTNEKNDFAKWVDEVLLYPTLAAELCSARSQDETKQTVKDFLIHSRTAGEDTEHAKYLDQSSLVDSKDSQAQNTVDSEGSDQLKNSVTQSKGFINTNAVPSAPNAKSGSFSIELKSSKEEEPAERPGNEPLFTKENFRQYSDEDLEKFTGFAKKENAPEADPSIEYLKTSLQELSNMIKELRTHGKDPLIAELLVRALKPKIDYYVQSKSKQDYDHIIGLMWDVQREIEEADGEIKTNLADEILFRLKMESISMKNDELAVGAHDVKEK